MSGLHEGDVAPAPSRCRRGYNSPVLTLYFTNLKLPARPTVHRSASGPHKAESLRLAVKHRQSERALTEELEALVGVERMVQPRAHISI
jgi:hypothetical protein